MNMAIPVFPLGSNKQSIGFYSMNHLGSRKFESQRTRIIRLIYGV